MINSIVGMLFLNQYFKAENNKKLMTNIPTNSPIPLTIDIWNHLKTVSPNKWRLVKKEVSLFCLIPAIEPLKLLFLKILIEIKELLTNRYNILSIVFFLKENWVCKKMIAIPVAIILTPAILVSQAKAVTNAVINKLIIVG